MKIEKLEQMLTSYDNGNCKQFWQDVKKLSCDDRARLMHLARSYSVGGTKFAFEIAERCITKDFN